MIRLSVNINKIATLRNARGGVIPNVVEAAKNCERFGAKGITVHPRPDERHIRYTDVIELSPIVSTEFNIEGYPNARFIELVLKVKPHQVTLVPDSPDVLTSNAGWDTLENKGLLTDIVGRLKEHNIRTSLFMDPDENMVRHALDTGTDRIELYTESYASSYNAGREEAIASFLRTAKVAESIGLGVNAGHDLNLDNLRYFVKCIDGLLEVSIGHALISDALYFGLENTIQMYLQQIELGERDKQD